MKAEEKFPNLSGIAGFSEINGNPEVINELRELLTFWDAHQWQPIESSPRDGFEFEIWASGKRHAAYWSINSMDGVIKLLSGGVRMDPAATHWRPLSKGPSER